MSTASDLVLAAKDGAVTTLTLNRPDKRNALNVDLLNALCRSVATAEADPTCRVLVLRGAGTVFCSGLDLAEAASPNATAQSAKKIEAALRALAMTRLMTIAAVQGAAVAGGAGLMCACDFAIATSDAKFGFPEVRRGIVPALIMTFLRRQLRERDARELLLLAKLIDAKRALEIGLLNRVVADDAALSTEIRSLGSSLLQGGPETLARTKQLLAELWPSAWEADFARAHAVHVEGRTSAEAAEGVAAFNAKRAPNWAR